MKNIFRYLAVPIIWAAIIFFVYSIPGGDIVYQDLWSLLKFDKLVHMGIFALWVNMLIVAFKKQSTSRPLKQNARLVAVSFALAYGGILEFYQSKWFIDRTTDPYDFIANTLGAFIGLLVFRIIYGKCAAY